MRIAPDYRTRFIAAQDAAVIVNLYHLARTALTREPHDRQTPYERKLWAAHEYARTHPICSETGAYKDLCGLLGH